MFAWTRAQALLILALTVPVPARSACQVELLELPVKMIGSRAVATVGINGTPVPLTVDSGAFFSFLTEAAAAQLQLRLRQAPSALRIEGITGRVDASVTTVDKLQLLKGDIPRVDFLVGGNEPGAGTMGLMGRNLLAFTDTEYDLANGVIRFSFPNDDCAKAKLAYWAGGSHVSEVELEPEYRSRSKTAALRARIKLNGTELVALFDTGASTLVSLRSAQRAGVAEAQMTPSAAFYGAGRGSARSWTAPFARVEIGDETVLNNRLHVGDFTLNDADLLVGIDFFLSHRIYVSKQQGKMYFTYNGGTVFALNRSDGLNPVPVEPEPAASEAQAASADQLTRRAAALASRHEYERALAEVTRAVELEPTSAAHYAQRGGVLEALKRPAKAIEDYDKAIELDPARTDARFRRAVLRVRLDNRDDALADLDALDTTLAPQAHLRLAMSALYLQLEQPARSVVQLDQWLPAHPNEERRETALNSRCWARALMGVDLEKALADCNDAIARDGKNAAYFDSRGWVQMRLGSYEKAVADFDRALGLRPGLAFPLYGRGLARTRLGEITQGQADLDAARNSQADIDSRVKRAGLVAH